MNEFLSSPAQVQELQRRILELELLQTQREAEVARLEARAAELERMLHEHSLRAAKAACPDSDLPDPHSLVSDSPDPHSLLSDLLDSSRSADLPASSDPSPATDHPSDREQRPQITSELTAAARPQERAESIPTLQSAFETALADSADVSAVASTDISAVMATAQLNMCAGDIRDPVSMETSIPLSDRGSFAPKRTDGSAPVRPRQRARSMTQSQDEQAKLRGEKGRLGRPLAHQTGSTRKRPALIVSGVVHMVLLLALALVGLKLHEPRDQVAFTASVTVPEASPIESIQFENDEPTESAETLTESDATIEMEPVSPLLPATRLDHGDLGSITSDVASALQNDGSASAMLQPSSNPAAAAEFCGIEGGGNHFVYLVDSSKSMGPAFQSARQELLRSIQMLKPDQRFYVIFFDEVSDYMRVQDASSDESSSLPASESNKSAVARWALEIKMDSGRAPYEPLEFALKLKPDVIFLLSDGEFPEGIETLLAEQNYVENLFGERQRTSIVHTIGYHSQRGQARMQRIAQQHGGQYRHVPKPNR